MHSIHSGDRLDLQVLPMLDSDKWELAFIEISQLVPCSDKHNYDWKKLNRTCAKWLAYKYKEYKKNTENTGK